VSIELEHLVQDIGTAIKRIDSRRPQTANARTGAAYQRLERSTGERYERQLHTDPPYRVLRRQKCDLCIGSYGDFDWAVEI
jgi:hypothetical protein